jgi:hypothetical protein
MAEAMKMSKKPMHPPFPRMVCEAMHGLDAMETTPDVQHHGHSMQSIKKYMGEHYKLSNGWEKRLNNAVKMMLKKKQLAHAAGHMGSFRLSKSMAAKEEKRMHRKPREAKAPQKAKPEFTPVKLPKRKAGTKMEGPAKRAKKATPKKAPAKKA